MPILLSLDEANVRSFTEEANALLGTGHAQWHSFINGHKFETQIPDMDPLSDAFIAYQDGIWKTITGKSGYDPETDEANNNLVGITSVRNVYPFSSNSPDEVGNYFFGVANVMRHISHAPPAKIVEFGIGWGHTTRMLANCGYDVTAVDIEENFLKLLDPFALQGASPIQKIRSSFTDAQFADETIDCFVFFECFHHCLDHRNLVYNLHRSLRQGGRILFCAEAFYDDWFDYPWGVRLDGHSVWAIRNFGWMELGFRKSYITALLEDTGFDLQWSSIEAAGAYGEMLVATKR